MIGFLDALAESCHYINHIMVPDGWGGSREAYTLGGPFKAVVQITNSLEQEVAEAQGVTGVYSVNVEEGVRLDYHQIFQRDSDGKCFRVTSKDENKAPAFSAIDPRFIRAEEFTLPQPLEVTENAQN